jgi:hypothetical protein
MKNKKYHTVGTVTKSNGKIINPVIKPITLTYIHITSLFPGLIQ